MGFKDTFHFDSRKYARHLKEDYSDHQLKKKHHQKCFQIIACSWAIGSGIGAAPFTFGATLASSTYALRQAAVLNNQRKLIEEECRYRNIPVPRERKRDIGIGYAVGIGTMGLSAVIPLGVDSLSGEAIGGAASTAATAVGSAAHHLSPHSAELAANHAARGLAHGIKETLTSQTHHLAHHGTVAAGDLYAPFQHLSSCDAATSAAGVGVGVAGTMKVEGLVGNMVGGYALDNTGRKFATPHH